MRRGETAWKATLISGLILFAGCGPTSSGGDAVTTGSLFEEMIDMAALSVFPDPAYKTVQFSSYDRRSMLAGGPQWFANSDGFGGEPVPGFDPAPRARPVVSHAGPVRVA